jgi:predicted amidohydrolase
MTSYGNGQNATLEKGEEYCRLAANMGADIALFPEMWNIGYALPKNKSVGLKLAINPNGSFVDHFKELAREIKIAIAITYLEKKDNSLRDSLSIINCRGEICLTYAKVHTCDFDLEKIITSGNEFFVCNLDTNSGPVKIGTMICFDREFPESARILMLKGAEIILVPNACTLDENRIGQLRARAFENMVGIAVTNYAAPQYNGHSVAFDGMAYEKDGQSRMTLLVQADEKEGVYLAEFDIETLREYRKREVWGNAFRKPGSYHILTSNVVNEPFIRKTERK